MDEPLSIQKPPWPRLIMRTKVVGGDAGGPNSSFRWTAFCIGQTARRSSSAAGIAPAQDAPLAKRVFVTIGDCDPKLKSRIRFSVGHGRMEKNRLLHFTPPPAGTGDCFRRARDGSS